MKRFPTTSSAAEIQKPERSKSTSNKYSAVDVLAYVIAQPKLLLCNRARKTKTKIIVIVGIKHSS